MSKAGKELLAALENALEVAKCEHEMIEPFPLELGPKNGFARQACKKCGATFYMPLGDTDAPC